MYYCTVVWYKQLKFSASFCFKILNSLKRLFICLHVSKRFGVEPPGLIKLEKEIEQEETLSAPLPSPSPSPTKSPGKKSTGKLLDDAVSCGGKLPSWSVSFWCTLVCAYLQNIQRLQFKISLCFRDLQTDSTNLLLPQLFMPEARKKCSLL